MNRFSDAEKMKAAEREVKWRRQVYPGRVRHGRMTPEEADYQTQIMIAISEDYRSRVELPLELKHGNVKA